MAGQKNTNAEVRKQYAQRLIGAYGYSLEQMYVNEHDSVHSSFGEACDIALWSNAKKKGKTTPLICVQCKSDEVLVDIIDYVDGLRLASEHDAKFFVAVNAKESRVYKVSNANADKTEELVDIPLSSQLENKKEIDKKLKQKREFTRESFSQALTKCHNTIRNNDKLSPEAAFDEISKILFIKIRYERSNIGTQVFSGDVYAAERDAYEEHKGCGDLDCYQMLFAKTRMDRQSVGLFDIAERLRIRENSFEQIVRELEIFNLSNTADDVKGIAYEQVLGRTFRGELGQFFTPRPIVEFMVHVLDPKERELICDPCCGSGGFLINTFEHLRKQIELDAKNRTNVSESVRKRLHHLSHDYIFGTDANPRMARTAKMNMIMHGDGHGGIYHHDGLLDVGGVFDGRFDVILTNPPFGSHVSNKQLVTEADVTTDEKEYAENRERFGDAYVISQKRLSVHVNKPILDLFDLGKSVGLTEVIFIERCLKLLKPGGRLGIVLPEGVLNNPTLQMARDYVESKARLIFDVSIPQDVFSTSGAKVKPSLIFLRKFTEEEQREYDKVAKDIYAKTENAEERRKLIKEKFAYQFPIAEVKNIDVNAIDATDNEELKSIEREFIHYRTQTPLW